MNKLKYLFKDQKAQISAEMIILIAAIIAIVLVVVTQLQKTTTKANKTVDDKADDVFKQIEKID
ncbi:class III signal peptide-containing protein [archaeon]|nr:class III signal peptide-containing protein [archaeon]NCP79658.1 class III signal peptide-containing protein [archaeon]NCP97948.1 class III signal peptide-containing protein [archaeon]NCQ07424.1 class III signal peptide-containing protein [archaeon]NCQ51215.1 class III signal peptide-containing protein [archaeon]